MAPYKRFNPVEFYRKAASTKPLSVAAPATRRTPVTAPRLSTVGHLFDKAAPLIADYITAEREKKRSAAARTEMKDVLSAYYNRGGERAKEVVLNAPMDIDETSEDVDRDAEIALGIGGIDALNAMDPSVSKEAQDMRVALTHDAYRQRREREARDEKRLHAERVAERKIRGQIEVARAKPGTDPTRYKLWNLSGSKLSFEKWMEKYDLQKIGLRLGASGEPPTAIPGGPADLKQQRVKLQETSNALLRRKVELLEQRGDPEYIKRIERIRKSEGYLIDLKKSRPKAEGALKTLEMKSAQVQSVIKDALPLARSMWSAGFGVMLKGMPESSSRKLAGLLINLRAIIGFDTLAEMRANSPTGGALGQVSNIEINLLQAVKGTLDQGQREILVRSLEDISKNYPQLVELGRTRFRKQYAPLERQPGSKRKVIRLDVEGNVIP
jgi:hypothetical protein